MKKAYHIAVEGSSGVGKTSLSKILAAKLQCKLILKSLKIIHFFQNFIKIPKGMLFKLSFFLLSRYKQQLEFQQIDIFTKSIVSDYMFMKDRIFASLNLSDKEMNLYDNVALILEKNMINPDLIIFLQSDTDRLMKNIKTRGRNYESSMDWNYIDALNQIYNEFFFRYDKSPLLIINTNDIDFVNDKNDLNEILNIIQKPINGTKYYNPNKSLKL